MRHGIARFCQNGCACLPSLIGGRPAVMFRPRNERLHRP
jgi:hypothetical protein